MLELYRREFLLAASSLACSAALSRTGAAQEESAKEWITRDTQRAIDRGLAWLAKRQVTRGNNVGAFGQGGYQGGVAVCGLGGLAFMCGGSPPGQGPYGKYVDKCVDFLLKCVGDSGYIAVPGVGMDNMYGHGFAMLFLSEAYGMSTRSDADKVIGEKLRKAVDLTVKCQNDAGGWRYQPQKSDADLSITICQIMGLRAARDAGIHVPEEVRDKCIDYVKKSQNADGGFRYTLGQGGGSGFPLTAAGIVSLYSAGIYEGEPIEKALKHLMKFLPGKGSLNTSYFFYGHYYAVQAMWHAGGEYWATWFPAIRETLLARQNGDGSWADTDAGTEFGTAMACIILQMPNNYLPIFTP